MSAALHQIVIIFISILVGFICRKCRVQSAEWRSHSFIVKHCSQNHSALLPVQFYPQIRYKCGYQQRIPRICFFLRNVPAQRFRRYYSAVASACSGEWPRCLSLWNHVRKCDLSASRFVQPCRAGTLPFTPPLLNIPYNLLCFSLGIWLLAGKLPLKKYWIPHFLQVSPQQFFICCKYHSLKWFLTVVPLSGRLHLPELCWSSVLCLAVSSLKKSLRNGGQSPTCFWGW